MNTCRARRVNDQMQCGQCGLQWDIDDADRPRCQLEVKLVDGEIHNLTNAAHVRPPTKFIPTDGDVEAVAPEKPNPRGSQHPTASEVRRVTSEAPKPTYAEVERREHQTRRDELIKMRRLLGLVVPGDILKQRHGHDTFTAVGHQTNSGEVLVSAPNREKSFFIRVEMVHNLTRLENEKT